MPNSDAHPFSPPVTDCEMPSTARAEPSSVGREGTARPHHQVDTWTRMVWLKNVVAGSWLLELLLCSRLWTGPRDFPLTPVIQGLPTLPTYLTTVAFMLLLGLLVTIILQPRPRKLMVAALLIVAAFALYDQTRWQPWFYQYYFMLAVLALSYSKNEDNAASVRNSKKIFTTETLCNEAKLVRSQTKLQRHRKDLAKTLDLSLCLCASVVQSFFLKLLSCTKQRGTCCLTTCRLMVAAIYFYSGLQKVNLTFATEVFPWLLEPITQSLPPQLQSVLLASGLFAPFLEMSVGVGLLLKGFRTYAIIMAVTMHVFILFVLGPLGHNWGMIVWPWNLTMIALVFILNTRPETTLATQWFKGSWPHLVIRVLFVVMPALSFFNLWDSYLSWTLYSGNVASAEVYLSDTVKMKLPVSVLESVSTTTKDENVLSLFDWARTELNVPPYPETRVYQSIARDLCSYAAQPSEVRLVVQAKKTWLGSDEPTSYDCSVFVK
jgi:uncharacterized membrane protein YphA (DoxX/SURF4 family)